MKKKNPFQYKASLAQQELFKSSKFQVTKPVFKSDTEAQEFLKTYTQEMLETGLYLRVVNQRYGGTLYNKVRTLGSKEEINNYIAGNYPELLI